MAHDDDIASSVLFDFVDQFARGRESGAPQPLRHYLARFPGFEEEIAREYFRLIEQRPVAVDRASDDDAHSRSTLADAGPTDHVEIGVAVGSRYTRGPEFARGGMGMLFEVVDEQLRRKLAMKVILGAGARSRSAFVEEAQVTAQLDHPGVVPVHELGVDSDGRLFFTMKLVKGRNLKHIIDQVHERKGEWSLTRALGVLLKVCDAMAYAHDKGVIHRDLKPANVMVGKYGEVYVMDWGLARVLGREDQHDLRIRPPDASARSSISTARREQRAEEPDSPLVTMDGEVVGTPSYMPPEQAMGQIDRIGPHSDVYSLGAMLYHLIGGEMPFVRRGARVSQHTVLVAVMNGPPKPLAELAPHTPAELIAICEKAMARAVERRYASVQALAGDLRAYLEQRVVGAYEGGAWAEARKWVGRNRQFATALAGVVLAITAGGVLFAVKSHQAVLAADDARNAQSRADQNALEAAESAQRAKLNEARAIEQERVAHELAADVLSLSAQKDLDDLVARANELWPPHPENVAHYERWLADARELVNGRAADPQRGLKARPSLAQHRARLAEIRSQATPLTDAAKRATFDRKRDELTWYSRMVGAEPWPTDEEAEAELAEEGSPPTSSAEMNVLAFGWVDPTKPVHGAEVKARVLALRALETAPLEEVARIRDTLAWAYFRTGMLDEALAELKRAFEAARDDVAVQRELLASSRRLEKAVAAWRPGKLAARLAEHAELVAHFGESEGATDGREEWEFTDPEARWWHSHLARLVAELETLDDPDTGLAGDNVRSPHGWGVLKRYEFAKTIAERSVDGAEARERWSATIEAISTSPRYGGLQITPQMGLLPLGADPESGLWEFAHLQTGEPPERGSDGRLVLTEQVGLVLVLLPGATYWRGAQGAEVDEPNYDPLAQEGESPVREITLSPFFVSKYEMTQGQWLRSTGGNPSAYRPPLEPYGIRFTLLSPVERVTWTVCNEITKRLGLFLPSEAQWEYACRGGTTTSWWTGDERESLCGAVNVADVSRKLIAASSGASNEWPDFDDGWPLHCPIGSTPANPFGLHEMHGNLWEWCEDTMIHEFYERAAGVDPVASGARAPYRMVRGGSYNTAPSRTRSAHRRANPPANREDAVGLRPGRLLLP